jgi:hypothetical protein
MPTVGNVAQNTYVASPAILTINHAVGILFISVTFSGQQTPPTSVVVDGNPAIMLGQPSIFYHPGTAWFAAYYYYASTAGLSNVTVLWTQVGVLLIQAVEVDNVLGDPLFDVQNQIFTQISPYSNPIAAGTPNRLIVEIFQAYGFPQMPLFTAGQQIQVDSQVAGYTGILTLQTSAAVNLSGRFPAAFVLDTAVGVIDAGQLVLWRKRSTGLGLLR